MMENSCWFKDWFNSPYYHLLYNNRDEREAQAFIDIICDHLKLSAGAKIWDLACGKGRHSIAFARKGYFVTGTDLSEKSISSALEANEPNTEFYVHDMRKPFRTNYFDCVSNLFTSIGYFEKNSDNKEVFTNVYNALKPGGRFVIDFFNADKVIANLVSSHHENRGHIDFKISKTITNGFVIKKIDFSDHGHSYSYEEKVALLKKSQFETFATEAGFKLENVFGDYALHQFDAINSDRLILVLKK